MKKIIKTTWIQLSLFVLLISSFWIIYAAWNDTVSPWSPLTAESWNEVLQRVSIFSTSNWNLWIWNSNPEAPLHVQWSVKISSQEWAGAPNLTLEWNSTSSWWSAFNLWALNDAGESITYAHFISDVQSRVDGSESARLIIRNRQTSNWNFPSNAIVIDGSNGNNVWIWNSNPWSKLSVSWLPSGTSLSNAGLDSTSAWAVCIAVDGDMYIDTDGVCN